MEKLESRDKAEMLRLLKERKEINYGLYMR